MQISYRSSSSCCFPQIIRFLAIALMLFIFQAGTSAIAQGQMTSADLDRIGKRIWQNECGGRVDGLTSWNSGEDFASLGIGHFIWYPEGRTGPFEESFPSLLVFLQKSGVAVPQWLAQAKGCPWSDRQSFLKDANSPRQKELRVLLASTVPQQTSFIIRRLEAATPKLQAAAGLYADRVSANIQFLSQTPAGCFAMIDYVNFKGEGLKSEERYNGQGWGLLQVLSNMDAHDAASAPREFAKAAKAVLARRVQNSPPARNEKQWLQGWHNRCDTYAS